MGVGWLTGVLLRWLSPGRKQDMGLEDGGWINNRGPLKMAISNRKQDMPSEDGDGVVN